MLANLSLHRPRLETGLQMFQNLRKLIDNIYSSGVYYIGKVFFEKNVLFLNHDFTPPWFTQIGYFILFYVWPIAQGGPSKNEHNEDVSPIDI